MSGIAHIGHRFPRKLIDFSTLWCDGDQKGLGHPPASARKIMTLFWLMSWSF